MTVYLYNIFPRVASGSLHDSEQNLVENSLAKIIDNVAIVYAVGGKADRGWLSLICLRGWLEDARSDGEGVGSG
jgi:hypothetical protein